MIFLLHIVLNRVTRCYSSGRRADLEGSQQLPSQVWSLCRDDWKTGLSWDCPPKHLPMASLADTFSGQSNFLHCSGLLKELFHERWVEGKFFLYSNLKITDYHFCYIHLGNCTLPLNRKSNKEFATISSLPQSNDWHCNYFLFYHLQNILSALSKPQKVISF